MFRCKHDKAYELLRNEVDTTSQGSAGGGAAAEAEAKEQMGSAETKEQMRRRMNECLNY
jgi:hypothetical protein